MGNTIYQPHKSSLGIDANLMAVAPNLPIILMLFAFLGVFASIVALIFALALSLIIFFLEKNSLLVKFSAAQATVVNLVCGLIIIILLIVRSIVYKAMIKNISYDIYNYYLNFSDQYNSARTVRLVFLIVIYLVVLAFIGLQTIVALKSFKYTQFKLPVFGGIAEKLSEKLSKVNLSGTGPATPPPSETWNPPAQGYTPPTPPYTPPAPSNIPPAQQWTTPAQPYTPPVPPTPAAQPMFDTQTGERINPPATTPPAQKFDTETGLPINEPPKNNGN